MIVGTEKVLREAGGPVRRAGTSVKSARRVERWSPLGAPQNGRKSRRGARRSHAGEHKETIKKAAMPCTKGTKKHLELTETAARSDDSNKIQKTKHACIVEVHESTRKRLESSPPKDHDDRIAGKGFTSMSHCNLVHKFILMPQAMKILDGKSAVDNEWKKLETIPAWQLDKVESKREVILEAQRDNNKVHFATLMDLCHLKNAELEPKFQKYKGRVVLQ